MKSDRLALAALLALIGSLTTAHAARAQNVTELYVTPDTIRLGVGQRQGLMVQAFDDAGNAVLAVRFRVADTAVARVAANGAVTATRAGRTVLTVEAGSKTKAVPVMVTGGKREVAVIAATTAEPAVQIASLAAEPASLELLPSEHARIGLRALAADGSVIAAPDVIWRSLRPEVVAVSDSFGYVTALSPGQGVLEVVANGATVSVPVSVVLTEFALSKDELLLAPGEADSITVSVPRQRGRRLQPADLQWSVSDGAVLDVRPDGMVRALAPGRADVIVRGFQQERHVPVVVHQRVAHFLASPRLSDPVRLPVQASREFTLIPQTVDSVPIEGVPVTWTVGDTTIATFDPVHGLLSTRRPGTTTLTFEVRGFAPKGWTIEVLPGTIALAESRLSLRPGQKRTLAARFVDKDGSPVAPATGLSWVTSNAGVARVTPDGAIEAMAPGRATVTAQARGGAPAEALVFVTGDLLVSSTRGGRYGIYAISAGAPETFLPVVADTFANSVDAVYSPDRTRMVFASDRFGEGNFDIFVAEADGRNPVRLTTDPAVDHQPAWTPDGRQIVFTSGRGGARQVYVMDADGRGAHQLSSLPGGAEEPAVSPDGRSVAFVGYPGGRDGQADIFVVPLEGGTPVAVTRTPDRREARPFYLPGGELAWVQLRRDRKDPDLVMKQPVAGGPATALVTSEETVVDVALAQDGSRIAWVSSHPSERGRNVVEFTFQWRSLASGAETSVRLLPGERITSPAF